MKPHPHFRDREIPRIHALGIFRLKALSVDDLVRDYCAVMESAADIKAANPSMTWPEGLTLEENLTDLAWHQTEFRNRRSFAWIIEDADGTYLGCLYVYPSISGEDAADVHWWWRPGNGVHDDRFRDELSAWLSGRDWPPLDYRLQGK
ncbi:hypothetical protein [Tropicimonas sediminicola]|uniref:GNAT family N-acetyltransferase n=1 Tax=Tropicimonas sediminicola TaxID=1031541 RepID=A0A239IGT4_9RHOB|nr:hypothetical protein [Tropicimonas sediminicola]SNS92807.1 hypothetical protein SAMN05421757_104387 [Tropicimonas sediminicola]